MNLGYYLNLVKRILLIEFKKLIEYRVNFLLNLGVIIIVFLLNILFWKIIFGNSEMVMGWVFEDAILLVYFVFLSFIIYDLFHYSAQEGFNRIKFGGFDRYLLYPVNPIFNLYFRQLLIYIAFSEFIVVVPLFFYLLNYFSFEILLIGSIMSIFGAMILLLFGFIIMSLTFWFTNSQYYNNLFKLVDLINFPLTLLNKKFMLIFVFIFPLIFMATFPAEFVRGNFEWKWIWYELFMFGLLLILAKLLWRKGLARYESGMG